MVKIDPSEVTPKHLYLSRRQFIGSTTALAAGALASIRHLKRSEIERARLTERVGKVKNLMAEARLPSWGIP